MEKRQKDVSTPFPDKSTLQGAVPFCAYGWAVHDIALDGYNWNSLFPLPNTGLFIHTEGLVMDKG